MLHSALGACEIPNHGFLATFVISGMCFSVQIRCKSNQEAVDYIH